MENLKKISVSKNHLVNTDSNLFISLGVNYYPGDTGWCPQPWKKFDPEMNLEYLELIAGELEKYEKPVILGEFGWYTGILPGSRCEKPGTEEQQAKWNTSAINITAPYLSGWINWGLYDIPQASDVSTGSGFYYNNGKAKLWTEEFAKLAKHEK